MSKNIDLKNLFNKNQKNMLQNALDRTQKEEDNENFAFLENIAKEIEGDEKQDDN